MNCRFEADVLYAVKEDRWTDALRRHLADCEDCTAAVSVAPWMDRFARMSDREHPLPDPSVVWLKAQILRGNADVARVTRPMTLAQLFAYFVVGGGWAFLLTWKWTAIQAWMMTLTRKGFMTSVAHADTLSLSFLGVVIVLASMTVMLALHTILAEE